MQKYVNSNYYRQRTALKSLQYKQIRDSKLLPIHFNTNSKNQTEIKASDPKIYCINQRESQMVRTIFIHHRPIRIRKKYDKNIGRYQALKSSQRSKRADMRTLRFNFRTHSNASFIVFIQSIGLLCTNSFINSI